MFYRSTGVSHEIILPTSFCFGLPSVLVILFCALESIEKGTGKNTVVNHLEQYVFIKIAMNFQNVLSVLSHAHSMFEEY